MRNIFKALDGGHLDDALFGSQAGRAPKLDRNAKKETARPVRRSRLLWGSKETVAEPGEGRHTSRSDTSQ